MEYKDINWTTPFVFDTYSALVFRYIEPNTGARVCFGGDVKMLKNIHLKPRMQLRELAKELSGSKIDSTILYEIREHGKVYKIVVGDGE